MFFKNTKNKSKTTRWGKTKKGKKKKKKKGKKRSLSQTQTHTHTHTPCFAYFSVSEAFTHISSTVRGFAFWRFRNIQIPQIYGFPDTYGGERAGSRFSKKEFLGASLIWSNHMILYILNLYTQYLSMWIFTVFLSLILVSDVVQSRPGIWRHPLDQWWLEKLGSEAIERVEAFHCSVSTK